MRLSWPTLLAHVIVFTTYAGVVYLLALVYQMVMR